MDNMETHTEFITRSLETFELLTIAITDLRQRVGVLEAIVGPRAVSIGPEVMNPPTELPSHSHTAATSPMSPDETDRSYHVALGHCLHAR